MHHVIIHPRLLGGAVVAHHTQAEATVVPPLEEGELFLTPRRGGEGSKQI
jgi:hypothetical protein